MSEENKGSLRIFNNHNGELIEIKGHRVEEGKVVFESSKFSDYVFIIEKAKETDTAKALGMTKTVQKGTNTSVVSPQRQTSANPKTGDNGIIMSAVVVIISCAGYMYLKRRKIEG